MKRIILGAIMVFAYFMLCTLSYGDDCTNMATTQYNLDKMKLKNEFNRNVTVAPFGVLVYLNERWKKERELLNKYQESLNKCKKGE